MEPMPPCMEFFQVEILSVMTKCTSIIFLTFLEVSFFSFQVHSEHLCSLTAHSGMWPQPPPGGFLVPPIYCPVSTEIICGPRRPLAKQPARGILDFNDEVSKVSFVIIVVVVIFPVDVDVFVVVPYIQVSHPRWRP